MKSRIFMSILATMLLCVSVLADSNAGRQINTLPWEIIAEKFDAKGPFCTAKSKDGKMDDFALTPDALTLTLPSNIKIPQEQTEAELNLSVWQYDLWADSPPLAARIDSNDLTVDSNAIAEGFYNLSVVFDKNDIGKENTFHAVVAADWKKDLLTFCRNRKEQIETNPDSQLIHSSIAVSHFDHVMELVSKASALSRHILDALSEAIGSKKKFDQGECPDLVKGLTKIRLKRFEGAGIAEFVIFVPESYDGSKKWPVFLRSDPIRDHAKNNYSQHSGLIDVWWHFPLPMGFEWKDYKYLLNVLKNKLKLDEDRIYVDGGCGNAIAVMALALKHPDQWAECSMALGNSYRHLAGNALNLPLIFVRGVHADRNKLDGYYDFAVKCFQYYGCKYFKYGMIKDRAQLRDTPTPEAIRKKSPQRVLYTIESLHNPRAYWVEINGRKDENFPATIDAYIRAQSIFVKTKNVDAYSLDLVQAPIDANRPIEIIENRQGLGFVTNQIFTRKSEKYIDAVYIKNEHLHGPVWDAFTDPYVLIWGTGGENEQTKTNKTIAESLANGGPCFADVNVPDELIDTHHLVIVGTPENNLWLAKTTVKLPVQIKNGWLITDRASYKGRDTGFIFIYPNPLNPERYVVVFSGISQRAMANMYRAYSQMKSMQPADIGIFEVTENGKIKWHRIEKFNTVWDWHSQWGQVLAVTDKKHPKWQWRQWVAKILREQLESDVAICEDPFRFADSVLSGQITLRELSNSFRNDWIVKIRLDGKNLRRLLIISSGNTSKREVATPTIDGVSFVKLEQDSEETVLGINELENDKKYTIALPYKAVNGERIGMVLKDYKIVGEGYLVSLLRDYLCKNENLDIDTQLDGLKLSIF